MQTQTLRQICMFVYICCVFCGVRSKMRMYYDFFDVAKFSAKQRETVNEPDVLNQVKSWKNNSTLKNLVIYGEAQVSDTFLIVDYDVSASDRSIVFYYAPTNPNGRPILDKDEHIPNKIKFVMIL
jgi:hypothetical protein